MSGLDKRVGSYEEALHGLQDGMTVLAGGFGLCGIPHRAVDHQADRPRALRTLAAEYLKRIIQARIRT